MPDAAALAAALTELVRRFAEVTDPARKEALAKQAREANVNIKRGNLIYAGEFEHNDGPWDVGDDERKYDGVLRSSSIARLVAYTSVSGATATP